MIIVNKDIIKKMNPCRSRFDQNYLVHYSDFNGNLDKFLDLDLITYGDKIWVTQRLLNKYQLVHFAILCAQSVLSIYENKYPNDKRVGDLLSFLVSISDFSNLSSEQHLKLRDLRSAAKAAADADYADAAYAAVYAADADAAAARKTQQDLNLQFLKIAATL